MLGHRGCRLGVTYPEIYQMQVEAIFEASINVGKKKIKAIPEIMIPLVSTVEELTALRTRAQALLDAAGEEAGQSLADVRIGTMIELPRACIMADVIAEQADFFSFGTNDLTQTTWGLSRDDTTTMLSTYVERRIIPRNPFVELDRDGVGWLMKVAVEKGRQTNKDIKLGICGEHGGEPRSVQFCHDLGIDYVSCSAFRVPVARLAAATANLSK